MKKRPLNFKSSNQRSKLLESIWARQKALDLRAQRPKKRIMMATSSRKSSGWKNPQTKIASLKITFWFCTVNSWCTAEDFTLTRKLASYLRAGLKKISLLKEDASWTMSIMWENSKLREMARLSKRAKEPATIATEQGTEVNGKMTKSMAKVKRILQMNWNVNASFKKEHQWDNESSHSEKLSISKNSQ